MSSAFGIKQESVTPSAKESVMLSKLYGNPAAIKQVAFESEIAHQRIAGNDVVILDAKTGVVTRLPGRKLG